MKKGLIISNDEIQLYLKDIKKIPILSNERQLEIITLLKTNLEQSEKQKLYNELILGNLRFVVSVSKQYQNQGLDLLDIISEGNIGLIKATEKYDLNSGYKFISYAVWWIKQSILSALNEYSRTIRLPSNLAQEVQKNKKNILNNNNNHYICDDEQNVTTTLPYCVGLFKELNDSEQPVLLIDTIANEDSLNPESFVIKDDEIKQNINNVLNILDDRERIIIEKYFGLKGVESNLDDLGEEFNCTKERIRQLKDKALKKLRNESYNLIKFLN